METPIGLEGRAVGLRQSAERKRGHMATWTVRIRLPVRSGRRSLRQHCLRHPIGCHDTVDRFSKYLLEVSQQRLCICSIPTCRKISIKSIFHRGFTKTSWCSAGMSRIGALALYPFHRQNCGMPDSDPSSTSSTCSDREIPAEDGGDGCRRREHSRLVSGVLAPHNARPASGLPRLTVSGKPTACGRWPVLFIPEERPVTTATAFNA